MRDRQPSPVGLGMPIIIIITASTINRAYRCLAENGVIVLGERRRARIAPDGALAAARFLDPERVFRLAGSDDPEAP